MSKVFQKKDNFIEFKHNDALFRWTGLNQKQLDTLLENGEQSNNEAAKWQLSERLSGATKQEFIDEMLGEYMAVEVVVQLDKMLSEAKAGKSNA